MEDLEMEVDDQGRTPDEEDIVRELVNEVQRIRRNSGVGSPEIAKHVAAWAATASPSSEKVAILRALAQELYQRRPILYLQGSSNPVAAQVMLRSVRKPSVVALAKAPAATASLFKAPSNTFIVIKFDPQFGYADILVDPFFMDAFIQQPATPGYAQLLQQLPRAFVGTAAELKKVVALITSQSIHAYASNFAEPQGGKIQKSVAPAAPAAHPVTDALDSGSHMPATVGTGSKLSKKWDAVVPNNAQQHNKAAAMKAAGSHTALNITAMSDAAHSKLRAMSHRTSNSGCKPAYVAGKLSAVAAPGISVSTGLTGNVYVVKLKP
eukprot:gene4841-5088_t